MIYAALCSNAVSVIVAALGVAGVYGGSGTRADSIALGVYCTTLLGAFILFAAGAATA